MMEFLSFLFGLGLIWLCGWFMVAMAGVILYFEMRHKPDWLWKVVVSGWKWPLWAFER